MKGRADMVLVARGVFESRARAQAAIAAGLVSADGIIVRKASESIAADAVIAASAPHPYVSRGGVKLAAALDHFGLSPAGLDSLDCGASTGGFSDVLLRRGAASVLAVDTGRGQFHPALAGDSRVTLLEGTDIRTLAEAGLARRPAFITCDVSFISLTLVLPALTRLAAPSASLVALAKPQFEVGRAAIGKGGIVRDMAAVADALARIEATLAGLGWQAMGRIDSPITGGDGNAEFLIAARRGPA
ncbi:MAG: TlyA family RNA methyltransferase [Beijerinckiaceae bacterium]|jgi:23S rRNA (cytidine1920-2'-O)/16S rRNA (cytidine1409-2'-O)-methyltransferase|nr:TlyA family RNA methyltransferase [Beijerinckiaceae bacterium]